MNAKKFSEAMGELDNRYVDEAIDYKRKAKKPGWLKWGAMAACLTLICVAAISLLTHNGEDTITAPGVTDAPPMVYVNGTLYKQSTEQISYGEPKENLSIWDGLKVNVTSDQSLLTECRKRAFKQIIPLLVQRFISITRILLFKSMGIIGFMKFLMLTPMVQKMSFQRKKKSSMTHPIRRAKIQAPIAA